MSTTIRIALGPQLTDFGSWHWLGEGLASWLQPPFEAVRFADIDDPPVADIVLFVKFLPSDDVLERVSRRSRLVFFPVDVYGHCREIDERHKSFEFVSKVIVHSLRLTRYFAGYCPVEFLDHPLKFITEAPRCSAEEGPLVWIGRRCNLDPIATWVKREGLDRELWLLTNLEGNQSDVQQMFGDHPLVRAEDWTEQRHVEYLGLATAAIDIKGDGFRARNKPPAKAIDYLASGIPLITNPGSSVDLHVKSLGLKSLYTGSWKKNLNAEHRRYCTEIAREIRRSHAPDVVWGRLANILHGLTETQLPLRNSRSLTHCTDLTFFV
ncbi:MAG: hypothetical protein WD049_09675 [Candidatus Paceibacterota bacterium]